MSVRCDFCYRECLLGEGQRGVCHIRVNRGGTIITENYGEVVAFGVDPIEKKPLYHFLPGSNTLSVALFGCNLFCSFCQNYTISQHEYYHHRPSQVITPKQLVSKAKALNSSISFTYSEPIVWQDYLLDVAALAKEAGLPTILVSSGTFSEASLTRILPFIDAYSIDLKGDEAFYKKYCKASAKAVTKSIQAIAKAEKTLEVTTLLIEGEHTLGDVHALGSLLSDMGVRVWHLSRYHPAYTLTLPATSEAFLREALAVAHRSTIPHIYGGNSRQDQDTYCPVCNALVISRSNGRIHSHLSEGRCHCSHPIYGSFV
ncbi:MAG: AmmeMemoRadiSam system radical SAM enzyme [Sphaerochaeta sp.]